MTLGLKLHPEIFPANNGRQDDGSLVKLTQSIQRMEKEEIKDDGVAQHMGKFVHHAGRSVFVEAPRSLTPACWFFAVTGDAYPSLWAGDDEKADRAREEEVEKGGRSKVDEDAKMGGKKGRKRDFYDALVAPELGSA